MKIKKKNTIKFSVFSVIMLGALVFYTLVLLIPLFWALITSFKSSGEFVDNIFWLPKKIEWRNYVNAFEKFQVPIKDRQEPAYLFEMLIYSLGYSVLGALSPLIATTLVSYVVVRFDRKFNEILTGIVIVTMCMPIIGSLASNLQMLDYLNLYDEFYGPLVSGFSFLGANFLILRSAFKGVPKSFTEAAIIDGANEFTIMLHIALPMIKTTLFILYLTSFIARWNDWNTSLAVMPSYPTLAYGLYYYDMGGTSNDANFVPMKLTGCMFLLIPIFVLFMIFKNKLIGNLSMGGLKE